MSEAEKGSKWASGLFTNNVRIGTAVVVSTVLVMLLGQIIQQQVVYGVLATAVLTLMCTLVSARRYAAPQTIFKHHLFEVSGMRWIGPPGLPVPLEVVARRYKYDLRMSCVIAHLVWECPKCRPCPPPITITPPPRMCPKQNCRPCPSIPNYNEIEWEKNWDRIGPAKGEANLTGASRFLVFVRHGDYNKKTGNINEKGKKQIELTAQRLVSLYKNVNSMSMSPYSRAVASANIIHNHFPNVKLKSLLGIREGAIPPEPVTFRTTERQYYLDKPRMESTFRNLFFRPKPGLIKPTVDLYVCHGNIMRFFLLRALQLPADAWMRIFLPNASILEIEIPPDGKVILRRAGETNHIPENMVTL